MARATKIKFGDYLNVTDEGGGVIRIDGCPPGGGGGGIMFDTAPQEGTFLQVTATNYINIETEGDGTDVDIDAGGAVNISATDGIVIHGHGDTGIVGEASGDGGINLNATGSGNVTLESDHGQLQLWADSSTSDVSMQAGHDVLIAAVRDTVINANRDMSISSDNDLTISAAAAGATGSKLLRISIDGGAQLDLNDDGTTSFALGSTFIATGGSSIEFRLEAGAIFTVSDSTGAPIFRVDEDGDLHGLTGKSLTFDL